MARPILCFYYLTYKCNARCSFCDVYEKDSPEAAVETVKKRLKDMLPLGVRYIDFTGGEPLLHPDLPELLEYAGELAYHTSVTTNCILYPRLAEVLRGKVDLLHFSLDSADKRQHDEIRGVECFDKVLESMDIAAGLGERPDILMTVTQDNYEQIEPLWELVTKYKFMLILNPVFESVENKPPDRDLAVRLLKLRKRKYLYNNTAFLKLILGGGNRTEKSRCRAVSATVVISPVGELLLPCFHHAVQSLSLDDGIIETRKSREFHKALARQGRYAFCEGCTINCYLDPSFVYKPDSLFLRSIIAKSKYAIDKYLTS